MKATFVQSEGESHASVMELIFCFSSYISGESDLKLAGGTLHFVENLKRWGKMQNRLYLVANEDSAKLLRNLRVATQSQIVILNSSLARRRSDILSAVFLFLCTIKALFLRVPKGFPRNANAICTESHFLPDIVAAVVLRRRYPDAKLIAYLHHLAPSIAQRRYHPLFPSILAYATQRISLSLMKRYGFYVFTFPYVESQLLDLAFQEDRIRLFNNGINLEHIGNMPASKETFDACFLGYILQRKGTLDLPKIWRRVCDKLPEAKLAVIGTGMKTNVDKLKRAIAAEKLEGNIFLLGYLPEREKFAIMKSSGIFLFPSYEEGWSIAMCEAMACGLPVVAYDLPAYKSVYEGGMMTVPIGSIERSAQAVLALLEDTVLKSKLSEEAKKQAAKYDLDEVAVAELSLIREICLYGSART